MLNCVEHEKSFILAAQLQKLAGGLKCIKIGSIIRFHTTCMSIPRQPAIKALIGLSIKAQADLHLCCLHAFSCQGSYEPRCEKTCLRGF